MDRVALIYNPASGQEWPRRNVVDKTLALLRDAGVHAEALETDGPGSAGKLAEEAVRQGYDTILACGGDGTVHEVLQCLVGTTVALGVVPLGTANALAADLGLGSSPTRTAGRLLDAIPVRVPVGRIFYCDGEGVERSRYFTVAAGVGADALFLSRLDAKLKRKLGYLLYLVEAGRRTRFRYLRLHFKSTAEAGSGWKECRNCWRCGFAISAACCITWRPERTCARRA